jgi:hypothetical protein
MMRDAVAQVVMYCCSLSPSESPSQRSYSSEGETQSEGGETAPRPEIVQVVNTPQRVAACT